METTMTSGSVPDKNRRRSVAGFKDAFEKRFGGKGKAPPFQKKGAKDEEDDDKKKGKGADDDKKKSVAERMRKGRKY